MEQGLRVGVARHEVGEADACMIVGNLKGGEEVGDCIDVHGSLSYHRDLYTSST